MARAFLNTNILVYADVDAGPKRAKAQALVLDALANGDAVIDAVAPGRLHRSITDNCKRVSGSS